MKIVFHKDFYRSDYAEDSASVPGRMEAIMEAVTSEGSYAVAEPACAGMDDLLLGHSREYILEKQKDPLLYHAASLAAGAAICASELAMAGQPAFAAVRPPGHHAYRSSSWGYCHFNNMAIAILRLLKSGRVKSAFILDFDAHTGDGTIDVLTGVPGVKILNPYAGTSGEYMQAIEGCINELKNIDIVGVCAGFDSYELDIGKKLSTFDFYRIGRLMRVFTRRMGHSRRFAVLEGGYYLPALGKNVLSFCQGFE